MHNHMTLLTCKAVMLQELVQKKRYGRLQKALADISLLAGSPADAQDHYTTAADLARVSNDWVWAAAALQGLAHAKVPVMLYAAVLWCACDATSCCMACGTVSHLVAPAQI